MFAFGKSNFLKFKSIIRKLKISLARLKVDANLFEELVLFERHYVMPDFMCLPLDTIAQKFKIEMRSPFLNPEFDTYLNNNPSQIYKGNKILLREMLTKKLNYKFSKKERFQL